MLTRLILPPLFLLCAVPSANAIQSQFFDAVKALPAELSLVKTCGAWEADGQKGTLRMIVADVMNGVGNELYVQWIAEENTTRRLLETLAFPELNDDHGQYTFQTVSCEQRESGVVITVVADYEHDENGQKHEISIELAGVGKYRLSDSSKSRKN